MVQPSAIPKNAGYVLPAMSGQKRPQMRLSLCELKLTIIDEISMVSNTTLLHIHQRLREIFDTNNCYDRQKDKLRNSSMNPTYLFNNT